MFLLFSNKRNIRVKTENKKEFLKMIKAINKFVDKVLTSLHLIKFREQILYIIVGGMTTVVDWVIFTLFALFVPSVGGEFIKRISPNILAYAVAWLGAVIFAYFLSRIFVFKETGEKILTQFAKFFGSRVITLVFSIIGDMLLSGEHAIIKIPNPWIAKLIISVVVIIVNYIPSKLVVFNKNKRQPTKDAISDDSGENDMSSQSASEEEKTSAAPEIEEKPEEKND